ncbi:MAG: PAS domain-containing protein, partial [Candidatus Cloacimonetes bacterium]|nr:PAS domain-containing protein [Candidatus Cloacimonadota bacterium]
MADKLRILIVEDVMTDAKLVEYELSKSGLQFESKIVKFKEDYIDALKNFKPDLVLSDFSLPRFDGKEAIKIIRKLAPQTPIIIVTGSINEQTAVECMKLGAWDYVLKDRLVLLGHSIKNTLELKQDRQRILQTQEELAKSEEQFRTFAENVPGVVSIYDRLPNDEVKFIYQGPGLEKIFGDKIAQKIYEGPSIYFKMIPDEDREKLENEAVKAVNSDGLLDMEYRLRISEDNYIWVRSSFSVTPMENGGYRWQGLIFEITAQKKMENELIENEKLLNKTQQMAHVGSWTLDLITQKIYWSEEISQILGVDDKTTERTLFNVMKRMHPEDLKRIRREFVRSLKTRQPYDIYHRIIRPNGTVRFIHTKTENLRDENGKVFKAIGMSQDITNIVETQEIIRKSEQLSLAIIEDSPIGISVRDKNGTLLLYNEAWKNIWGFSAKQVNEYRNPRKSLNLDSRDKYLGEHSDGIIKVYKEGGTYYIPEIKLEKKFQGKNKWISQRFYALKDENDNVERVVILSEDITVRKLAVLTQEVLYNIISAANVSNSLEDVFEETRNQLGRILDTTNLFIALYDDETKMLT